MFGRNPKRGIEKGDGSTLLIQEVFPTIQGEGLYVGHPAVFVRLGGCNLACEFCDTEFESFEEYKLEKLLDEVKKLSLNEYSKRVRKLVVITGGEPFRQNITPLCERLISEGFKVQIETNGTLYRELPDEVDIICSPKATDGKCSPIRLDLLEKISALKFIISASNKDYSDVADVGQSKLNIPVYIQPMDEYKEQKNKDNIARCLELSKQHGYLISLQTHKILGVD